MAGLFTRVSTLGLSAMLVLMSVPLAEAACGGFHRIKGGETLRSITIRHYGHDRYQFVFEANRDVLAHPSRIEAGQLIYLPCASGETRTGALVEQGIQPTEVDQLGLRRGRREQQRASIVSKVEPSAGSRIIAGEVTLQQPVTVLSGSGFAPLTDEQLLDGGLISKLVLRALAKSAPGAKAKLAFVNDWKAHLPILMPTGAFALGFPWPKPDCTEGGAGPASRSICASFVYSRPLYEVPVTTWVRRDSPLVQSASLAELAGRRLCRPRAFPPVDLEAAGVPLGIMTAPSPAACVQKLLKGEVDAISVPQPLEAALRNGQSAPDDIVPVPSLTRSVPVHALALRGSPDGIRSLEALDAGLIEMKQSGEWFQIVSRYLADYNAANPVTK